MAQYGLETETTVHIKGMQLGDSQPDTGGGNSYPLPLNATFLKPVSGNGSYVAQKYVDGIGNVAYLRGYYVGDDSRDYLEGDMIFSSGVSILYADFDGKFTPGYYANVCFVYSQMPEDATIISQRGTMAVIIQG